MSSKTTGTAHAKNADWQVAHVAVCLVTIPTTNNANEPKLLGLST